MELQGNIIFTGIGATALMDLWTVVRNKAFGTPMPNYALVGRWIAYMPRGRFRHASIAKAGPRGGEHVIGWTAHYVIGVAFAALLAAFAGAGWFDSPALLPALAIGLATVAAPFLVMQPAMGAGIAASRTPSPRAARLQSIVTHAIFGLGLYAAAMLIELFQQH
jgi:hypothetical protein